MLLYVLAKMIPDVPEVGGCRLFHVEPQGHCFVETFHLRSLGLEPPFARLAMNMRFRIEHPVRVFDWTFPKCQFQEVQLDNHLLGLHDGFLMNKNQWILFDRSLQLHVFANATAGQLLRLR